MKTLNIKLLTLIATYLVILLHTAAIPFSTFHSAWSIAVMYDALGRISFPLFLLIAGYISLNKNESLLSTLKTRVLDLLLPLIAWTVIYFIYNRMANGSTTAFSLLDLLSTPAYGHLWFIYTLILLFLVTPLLNTFIQHGSQQRINYILAVWFALASVYMLFDNFKETVLENHPAQIPSNIDMVVYLSGFYIIGGVVRRYKLSPKVTIATIIFILSAVLTAVMGYSLSISIGEPNEIFLFYSAPTIVTLALACFFMLLNAPLQFSRRVNLIIRTLARLSVGIFFVHMLVLETLLRLWSVSFNDYYSVLSIPGVALVSFMVSALLIYLMERVPGLKRLT
ncbi:acyltransferase [Erwinia sorbitola]|uniref:Acyltransferase family protein n=1 Tax=Erwinia sorbitola TaxID=2681984 RepID=A0A6I6EVW6_9GAMM|nr:acyltransferase family protein [Erwinia sorbitola]MTD27189.1 acyltransferase family protein [Erwinia sorbitola]QGU88742.1 acyltransferase family protein [Erwinia sorbitola]